MLIFWFWIYFPQKACFRCALCGKVTTFYHLSPKYTIHNPLQNKQVINVIIENNLSHKSGAKSMLCNVAINGFPLSLHIFIWTCPFWFTATWCPSTTSICLSLYYNETVIKSETCGFIRHVSPESKIQLFNCKVSPKYLLGLLSLSEICAIYEYIFWSLSLSPFLYYFAMKGYPFHWNGLAFVVSHYI